MTEPIDDVLPLFQGKRPAASRLRMTGGTDTTLHRAFALDEQVYMLVVGTVAKVGHSRDDKIGLVREQGLKVDAAWELMPELFEIGGMVKDLKVRDADVRGQVYGFPQEPLPDPLVEP